MDNYLKFKIQSYSLWTVTFIITFYIQKTIMCYNLTHLVKHL